MRSLTKSNPASIFNNFFHLKYSTNCFERYKIYTGQQFNQISQKNNLTFVKMTNTDERHGAMKYETGLNTDCVPFDWTGECKTGGLYFTEESRIPDFLYWGENVRKVTVPDSALVYIEENKYKTNKFILGEKETLEKYLSSKDGYQLFKMLQRDWLILHYINDRPEDFYINVVESMPNSLCVIKNQTKEICMAAVQKNPATIIFVKNQTKELCKAAYLKNRETIRFVRDPDIKMELESMTYSDEFY